MNMTIDDNPKIEQHDDFAATARELANDPRMAKAIAGIKKRRAKLLNAAPDLLAALKDMLAYGGEDAYEWDAIQDRAHAAVEKAEGQ
jgi:hypothetical protein